MPGIEGGGMLVEGAFPLVKPRLEELAVRRDSILDKRNAVAHRFPGQWRLVKGGGAEGIEEEGDRGIAGTGVRGGPFEKAVQQDHGGIEPVLPRATALRGCGRHL